MPPSTTVYGTPTDGVRIAFMEGLAGDLRLLGHGVAVEKGASSVRLVFTPKTFSHSDVASIYKKMRDRDVRDDQEFIARMEGNGIGERFIDGDQLNVERIRPQVEICGTQNGKDIYRYIRQLQSIPNSTGVGRRFAALVYDVGQGSPVLMAAIGLASASYNQGDRDRYLGWSDIDSRAEQKARRDAGLRRLMQLAVFMAVPPYDRLYGAKLAALLALSDPVQQHFQDRYGAPLLGLVTTVATREEHCAVLTRIQLSRLAGAERYSRPQPIEMYVHIGSTSEYTTVMISEETTSLARALVEAAEPMGADESGGGIRSARSKGRVIPKALRLCGIGRDVLFLNRKAVYFGYLHSANRALLSNFDCGESPMVSLPMEEAVTYWKDRWCERAAADEDWMAGLREFRGVGNLLSKDPALQDT